MKKSQSKLICLLLAICLFTVMAAGCGTSSSDTEKAEPSNSSESQTPGTPNTPSTPDTPDTPDTPSTPSEKDGKDSAKPAAATYTITDEVLVDDENITFKITKAEVDSIWGFTLKVFCENKTADKNLMFSIDKVSVNGYMCDPFWAEQVAAGKKSNQDISFALSNFDEIGIDTADEITFLLRVTDYDDWMADPLIKDEFTIYPTGLSADEVKYPERKTTPAEQVLVDNEEICFVILGSENDSIMGYTLKCYVENKTDMTLMFTWNDVSVNGYMCDPFWAEEITPGMRSYDDIYFSKSDFELNSITSVEDVEATLKVYDSENWSGNDIYNDTLTYKP